MISGNIVEPLTAFFAAHKSRAAWNGENFAKSKSMYGIVALLYATFTFRWNRISINWACVDILTAGYRASGRNISFRTQLFFRSTAVSVKSTTNSICSGHITISQFPIWNYKSGVIETCVFREFCHCRMLENCQTHAMWFVVTIGYCVWFHCPWYSLTCVH